MKVEHDSFAVRSNLDGQGDVAQMKVADGAMAHVMSILTRMYQNRIYAIIREYATNAWDAHVEAGVNRPIEVSLPTKWNPQYQVRDHGTGLSVEDIHAIYSQYGESTKRSSNDFNGMLGIGCKSALAYADQFTVVSVKDSVKITVVVARDEEGGGTMNVIDTRTVNEANGTTVTVPVLDQSDIPNFDTEAKNFFRFWEPNTVLVDGNAPMRFEGLKLADDLYITDYAKSYIVMGNVPYPVPELDDLCQGSVLAFVPIGTVTPAPPREGLEDVRTTKVGIEAVRVRFNKMVKGVIQREVDACAHPSEAIPVIVKWERKVPGHARAITDYTYKGEPLPKGFSYPEVEIDVNGQKQKHTPMIEYTDLHSYYRLASTSTQRTIPTTQWPRTLWVTNWNVKHTAQHKKKLKKYAHDNGLDCGSAVLLTGDAPDSKFIDPKMVVDAETIKKLQLPNSGGTKFNYQTGAQRIPGSYDFWTAGIPGFADGKNEGVEGSKIDQAYPIYFINNNLYGGRWYYNAMKAITPAFTMLCLPQNRIAKFERTVPAAQSLQAAAMDLFNVWVKTLTQRQLDALAVADSDDKEELEMFDRKKVDDPVLQDAIDLAKMDVSKLIEKRSAFDRLIHAQMPDNPWTSPFNKYPLMARVSLSHNPEHVYLYLNAVHAAGL